MTSAPKSKRRALKAALVVDQKVYDQVHQHAPERVSVGTDVSADFLVFGKNLPKRHVLFDVDQSGAYVLDLPKLERCLAILRAGLVAYAAKRAP